MGLELEIAKVQENPSDKRNNVVEFTSTASDKYPSLSMNGVTIGYVYDGEYEGVPYIMDPNDEDPNQPGSGGGPAGAMAGDPGMHGGFGGQGVSLMLRNKYSYSTSGTTKLDGDVWDNKSPTRSVMIIMDGFWPDEIESFNISNSDLSMNNMRVFTCSKASFDAYGGFSSAAKCTADNSSVSGITISKSMVSEGKIVFELGHSASLFKSGKSLDITSKAKKSKYSYSLKFRQPTDYAGNPFMCGSTACPSMPPMEGRLTSGSRRQTIRTRTMV